MYHKISLWLNIYNTTIMLRLEHEQNYSLSNKKTIIQKYSSSALFHIDLIIKKFQ